MEAFHGDSEFRERFIQGMVAHREEDRLRQGTYGELQEGLWRGCTIACQLLTKDLLEVGRATRTRGNARNEIAGYLDIPHELAVFQDVVFENLPAEEAQQWSIDFLCAIRCGADLSQVWPVLVHWMFGGLRSAPPDSSVNFRAYNVGALIKDYEKRRTLRNDESIHQIYSGLAKKALELVAAF